MITLLHGDNTEASRVELNRLRDLAKDIEIRGIDGRNIDSALLTQSLESKSLFGGDMLVVIERLFGKLGRQIKRMSEYCAIVTSSDGDIVMWEDKELSASVIKQLGTGVNVRLFKLPVLIFQFLDSLQLDTFAKLMETEAPELVFSMLIKRVRQLIAIADGGEPAGLQGWQVRRLTTQAKSFTMNQLISLYEKLGRAEYELKSGASPFTFRQALEQVLITI